MACLVLGLPLLLAFYPESLLDDYGRLAGATRKALPHVLPMHRGLSSMPLNPELHSVVGGDEYVAHVGVDLVLCIAFREPLEYASDGGTYQIGARVGA